MYRLCFALILAVMAASCASPGANLQRAIEGQKPSEVSRILAENKGIDLNAPVPDGKTFLIHAVDSGNIETIQILLEKGADPNKKAKDDLTPLAAAVVKGKNDIASLLLDKGADSALRSTESLSPLQFAGAAGNISFLNIFKEKGGTIDGGLGFEAGVLAINNQQFEFANLLLDLNEGAKTPMYKIRYKNGPNLVNFVSEQSGPDAENLLRRLLKYRISIEYKYADGSTPLFLAAGVGNIAHVRLLVEAGAKIDEPRNDGQTPLMSAAYKGSTEIVELLLAKGANVNAAKKSGRTVLMVAVESGSVPVVNTLIKAGADLGARDQGEHTPLTLAILLNQPQIARVLVDSGADLNQRVAGFSPLSYLVVASIQHRTPAYDSLKKHMESLGAKEEFIPEEAEAYNKRHPKKS